jgi:phage tail-like protein
MADWKGRGGGRPGSQPNIQPASGGGDSWVGRGGGRSPLQPTVAPAQLVQLMRAGANAVSNAIGSAANDMLGMPNHNRPLEEPQGSFVFALEINGLEIAHFMECSGLKSTTEIFQIKEGGANHAVHKLPGQSTWDNLILRYGVTSDTSMIALREAIMNDGYSGGGSPGAGGAQPKRFNGSIVMKNNRMQEIVRYTFKDAWAVSWEGPKLDSMNSQVALETLELAHHGIEISRSAVASSPMGWV